MSWYGGGAINIIISYNERIVAARVSSQVLARDKGWSRQVEDQWTVSRNSCLHSHRNVESSQSRSVCHSDLTSHQIAGNIIVGNPPAHSEIILCRIFSI